MKNIITADNISYSYNKHNNVLENLSFKVNDKDFIGIIGPNGGGKSTLLKIILGLIKVHKGDIEVFGESPIKARNKIGYVPQYSHIDLNYPIKVSEVITTGILGEKTIGSIIKKEDKDRVCKSLKYMNLDDLKNRAIGDLSGGQRQKVLIARALVRNPDLLILDEPTNNIDQRSGEGLYKLLHDLNKNMTIIIVSHDISSISKYVNKVFCLNKRIVCNEAEDVTGECNLSNFKHVHHNKDCIIN